MSPTALTLLAALVGAAAALAGQALAPMIESRRGHTQWVRDKRAALCEEYLALLSNAEFDLQNRETAVNLPAQSREEAAANEDRVLHRSLVQALKMGQVAQRLALYASEDMVNALFAVHHAYVAAWSSQQVGGKQTFDAADDELRNRMRVELGVRPLDLERLGRRYD